MTELEGFGSVLMRMVASGSYKVMMLWQGRLMVSCSGRSGTA